MLNGIETSVVGNLTADPNLVYTSRGDAVCNFSVALNPVILDRESKSWETTEAIFVRCTVWHNVAENVAESLNKGDRVIIAGRLRLNNYETSDGEPRSNLEMSVSEIGATLKFAQLTVRRLQRKQEPEPEPEPEPPAKNGRATKRTPIRKPSRSHN